jgi:hypothetical protein
MRDKTIVQQATKWFGTNCERLSELFTIVRFRLMDATDLVRGKIIIELSSATTVMMITFWNKKDVEAMLLDKNSKQDRTLDDRMLNDQDDIPALLQKYVDELTNAPSSGIK